MGGGGSFASCYFLYLMSTKRLLKMVASRSRPLLNFFLSIFFEKKYLKGRHFESGYTGYFWAFRSIWLKNILRISTPHPWPTGLSCTLSNPRNIEFHCDDLNNFQSPGTYFQNFKGRIVIGRGSYIGPNVGLITSNHNIDDLEKHEDSQDIFIGEQCWLGMNVVVLPGVTLGAKTIVAAGSVVTKSFPEGNVVLAGIPAKFLKKLT